MIIARTKISNFLLYVIFFLTFSGFYAILLLAFNAGMSEATRIITIPLRLLLVVSLLALIFINTKKAAYGYGTYVFLLFSVIYLSRIVADYALGQRYYLSTNELIFYFTSFAIVPFVAISTLRLKHESFNVIFDSLIFSGILFSILSVIFYQQFIGQVGRLTTSNAGEDVVSPLTLSYNSALVIGVVVFYLIFNKTTRLKKISGFLLIVLSIIPFFLGASRGALIAVFVPFLLMWLARLNVQTMFKGAVVAFLVVSILFYLDASLGSGLLDRFLGISNAIEEGRSSASRLDIWEAAFNQFLHAPIIGDKLRVDYPVSYAHNLFIEVLQTTGILGFIPIFFLILRGIKISFNVLKDYPQYSWIVVVFIQSLIKQMFSGAVYNGSWFWMSLALVFSLGYYIRRTTT